MTDQQKFRSFEEFYPFYLAEHSNIVCRRLHYTGSLLVIVLSGLFSLTRNMQILLLIPLAGYGFAWVGHYLFEKNRPATFQHPWYSFMGDWVMLKDMLAGRIRF